jgi:hypothetical protein
VKTSGRRSLWLPIVALAILAGCARLAAAPSGAGAGVGAATDTGLGTAAEPSAMKDYADGSPGFTPHGELGNGAMCAVVFSPDRCDALAIAASDDLAVPFERVRAIKVLPNPNPDQIDFAHRTFLSVTLDDGTAHSVVISCPGIAGGNEPKCMWEPKVPIGAPGGLVRCCYTDWPEGATPVPPADPAAVAQSRALRVPRLVVPITALGQQSIVVGRALLPNGLLRDSAIEITDPWPTDVHFSGGIFLEIRPVDGSPPLANVYEHGWRPGVEEVEATLTFSVSWFKPGASITIVNLIVR